MDTDDRTKEFAAFFNPALALREAAENARKPAREPLPPGQMRCPTCERHPLLEVVRTYEVVLPVPPRHCPLCLGIWVAGAGLSAGFSPDLANHPALRAGTRPRLCPQCTTRLSAEEVCPKCAYKRPELACPSCGEAMQRQAMGSIIVDSCAACRGIWFDAGELRAVYDVAARPSLSSRAAAAQGDLPGRRDKSDGWRFGEEDEPQTIGKGDLLWLAFDIARLFFLRF